MPWPEERAALLWVVRPPPRPAGAHLALLDERQRGANARLVREGHRARHACAHALLRTVLGSLLDRAPDALCIRPGENGRPALAGASAAEFPSVDFNLSGTPGLVACAVVRDGRVGVDLQAPLRTVDQAGLAERLFSPAERDWCARTGASDDAFYRIWTLKEAVSKADGRGLGLPFRELSLVPDEEGGLQVDLTALEGDANWRVCSLGTRGVAAALALRNGPEGKLELEPAPAGEGFDPVSVTLLGASPAF